MKTLETPRLILRDWQESDLDDFYAYACVEGVGEAAGWPHHESKEVSQSILKSFITENEVFAIVYKQTNQVIGSLGIHNRSRPECDAAVQREIGYVLNKDFWGKGIMSEAVTAAIDYAFCELGVDVLWCAHFKENHRSRRVIEKCGFVFHSDSVYQAKLLGKEFEDKVYRINRETYLAQKSQNQ